MKKSAEYTVKNVYGDNSLYCEYKTTNISPKKHFEFKTYDSCCCVWIKTLIFSDSYVNALKEYENKMMGNKK